MDIGLFGKLPSHGDFLRRRVSHAFVDAWDAWLQACLSASREQLGDRWLDLYLTSPIWRFVAAPGACGGAAVIGLMVPSVDRVGRYFPFTVVAELPEDVNLATAVAASAPFFERAEQLLVATLETERIDFDRFEAQLKEVSEVLDAVTASPAVRLEAAVAAILADGTQAWQIPLTATGELASIFGQMSIHRLMALYEPMTMWWTDGSMDVDPSCLLTRGLPPAAGFAALLDGGWQRAAWTSVPATLDTGATVEIPIEEALPLAFRSAAATDVGLARANNEDAFFERCEAGIWVVADGLGGHRQGEVASRMVCDAIADLVPQPTFDETLYAARERLQAVNDHLLRSGPPAASATAAAAMTDRSATTVVLLLARGSGCAVLWAGDSRLYRYRGGVLERMSTDHSIGDETLGGGSNTITRAVGVHPTLTLDLVRDRVHAGDRFLLCTDGLTRNVADAEIQKWMAHGDLNGAVKGLIADTLTAGAPDNVTVVLVEAYVSDARPAAV